MYPAFLSGIPAPSRTVSIFTARRRAAIERKPKSLRILFLTRLLFLAAAGALMLLFPDPAQAADPIVPNDGRYPQACLIQGSDGSFYGTTGGGGSTVGADGYGNGYGTVFKMTPSGTITILHSFGDGSVPNDGLRPVAALLLADDGNFYGTTVYGGSSNNGTVFKMTPAGTVTILHSFGDPAVAHDGTSARAALIQDASGVFFGATYSGGAGSGVAFRITPAGAYTILHRFGDGSVANDALAPSAPFVLGRDGDYYGTSYFGGTYGIGTVYKMTPTGAVTILHSFANSSSDGQLPLAPLVLGSDGDFHGTTSQGGTSILTNPYNSDGTVFKITPAGAITILHSFQGYPNDGFQPLAGLIQGSDGRFYGTTLEGGSVFTDPYPRSGYGTAFAITSTGALTLLHSFSNGLRLLGLSPSSVTALGPSFTLTVTGTGFETGSVVDWNGMPLATSTFYPYGAQNLSATVPAALIANLGTAQITIVNPDGTVSDALTETILPSVTLTSLSPADVGTGSPAFTLTVQGTGFLTTSTVDWNGTALATTYGSATEVTAQVPASLVAASGVASVTVVNPGVPPTNTLSVTVAPPPAPASFTPLSGPPGTVVTITGQNLAGVNAVRFHDANATSFSANMAGTQITVTVPTGALSGKIQVTTPFGSAQTPQPFTVTPSPTPSITSLTPASGVTGTGVTITGTNFTGITSVTFGGIPASFTVVSSTQITAIVPGTAVTGAVTVTNSGGTGTSPTPFTVTGGAPIPVSFTPASGPVGTVVTITGQRLGGVTAVRFNGASAAVFSASADGTQITVTVPAGALPGQVQVTTPFGSAQTPQPFIVTMTSYPVITGFTPSTGPVGTAVTITGTNLTGTTVVGFMGQHAQSFTVNPAGTQITTTVPAGAQTGPVAVLTNGLESKSAATFTVAP